MKAKFNGIVKKIENGVSKHSPEILIAFGITGIVTSIGLAVKATPKALELIEEEKNRINDELYEEAKEAGEDFEEVEKLKPVDVVKTTWKCYVPTVITAGASIACFMGANSIHAKRNAVLATAYKLSEAALTEYKDAVIEEIGDKKERKVVDRVAEKKIQKNPVKDSEVIVTEKGNVLCYDTVSGRYFKSDANTIQKAVNNLNAFMNSNFYVSLNEFYYELGLESISIGDDLGWNCDSGQIAINLSAQVAKNDEPCLVLNYHVAPRYDFSKLY